VALGFSDGKNGVSGLVVYLTVAFAVACDHGSAQAPAYLSK
jgi:hypothetical protein